MPGRAERGFTPSRSGYRTGGLPGSPAPAVHEWVGLPDGGRIRRSVRIDGDRRREGPKGTRPRFPHAIHLQDRVVGIVVIHLTSSSSLSLRGKGTESRDVTSRGSNVTRATNSQKVHFTSHSKRLFHLKRPYRGTHVKAESSHHRLCPTPGRLATPPSPPLWSWCPVVSDRGGRCASEVREHHAVRLRPYARHAVAVLRTARGPRGCDLGA